MFQSITWQEFLLAAGLLTGVYYAVVLLILRRSKKSAPLIACNSENSQPDVLGGINDDVKQSHTSSIDSDGISIAGTSQQDPATTETVDPLLLGSVSDLLEEAKTLTHFILENKSTTEEASTFLRTLLSKYSHLKGGKYQSAIELYLYNELKDDADQKLNLEEITRLWITSSSLQILIPHLQTKGSCSPSKNLLNCWCFF